MCLILAAVLHHAQGPVDDIARATFNQTPSRRVENLMDQQVVSCVREAHAVYFQPQTTVRVSLHASIIKVAPVLHKCRRRFAASLCGHAPKFATAPAALAVVEEREEGLQPPI